MALSIRGRPRSGRMMKEAIALRRVYSDFPRHDMYSTITSRRPDYFESVCLKSNEMILINPSVFTKTKSKANRYDSKKSICLSKSMRLEPLRLIGVDRPDGSHVAMEQNSPALSFDEHHIQRQNADDRCLGRSSG